ncbi:hypothetical protein AVEN_170264-1 [Araneus ventricosus]|uniref:Uncharacterized protein n=1 Tax=Araneus ventricosus TaxID=182803 RepID=A0A4Y2H5W2_ARAVE|nr:hypothetical protein AVEN_170264-1 [Araneus ventricosus]
MPVIKQRDTNEDCEKTLASTENKLAEDSNTSFIEEKSVKDRRPPKQMVKRVNGDLLPTKATQLKKRKKTISLTIKEMFQRVSKAIMLNESVIVTVQYLDPSCFIREKYPNKSVRVPSPLRPRAGGFQDGPNGKNVRIWSAARQVKGRISYVTSSTADA